MRIVKTGIASRWKMARDRKLTVANLVDELVRHRGDAVLSVNEDGAYHLSELHREVCAMDAFLRRTVGLTPGQTVAIYRSNDRVCFHWLLAIVRAGGIAVPLNPMLSLTEVQRILSESGTAALITDKTVFERTIHDCTALPVETWIQDDGERETMPGFLRLTEAGEVFAPVEVEQSTTVAVFHTSGTSGSPKGAALSSRALLGARSATVVVGMFLGAKDLALIALPWSHIMAVSIALNGMIAGIPGCFLERFDVERALLLVERLGITTFVGVPEMFARLLNSNPNPQRLKTVRVWLSASDALPAAVRERLRHYGAFRRLPGGKRIPPVILNGYGMVELGGLAMMGVDLSFAPGSGDWGVPVPPFEVRVVDEDGRPVRAGMAGECQIRRRGIRPQYWRYEDAELVTEDGWLRTGDLAVRSRLGLVKLVGRSKDVIKSGGYSVYARELEEAMLAHPAVARAVAFGLPHTEKGEIAVGAVELRADSEVNEAELVAWCKARLAGYKAPKRVWIVEAGGLPQNHNGKMLRRELRERFAAEASVAVSR
ncbi:class I adenylate-forming enzyme family protein [Acidicapsa dinghuensis]|uniref:Class I adenylate-forming enzyme family protein n=1 Tax=Acidicapsa dinghuensis TaxID=2218256 RepID=A0ABW1ECA6_9BACT|nr:class I adenylate-forming enzyme family protein [Acidicapsa dinghuensis]